MAKTVTVKARGLYLNPNDLGDVPDGSLAEATNVVISRDGIIETRRGFSLANATRKPRRIGRYKGSLLGLDGTTLYTSSDSGVTWVALTGSYSEPASARMRFQEASGNAYFNAAAGVYRLDATNGTPEQAGAAPGMDCQAQLLVPNPASLDGTGVDPNSQTGYRFLFAKRDANNNLLKGSPSQRAVVVNPSVIVQPGGVSVDGSQVVTVTAISHGFTAGQMVFVENEEVDTDTGVYLITSGLVGPISVATPNAFTYTDTGAMASRTLTTPARYSNGYRDVLASATIPPGVTSDPDYFFQAYKTRSSIDSDTDPGDECGLVYEGPIPAPATVSTLERTSNVALGTTTADHGWIPGTVVNLPTGLSGTTVTTFVAVGGAVAATSTDGGANWTTRTQARTAVGPLCRDDGVYLGPATDYGITSSDGTTWASAATGAPTVNNKQACYSSTLDRWAMVHATGIYTSTDSGATWGVATITSSPGTETYYGIAWDGSKYVAIGKNSASFITATSSNGTAWTYNVIGPAAYTPGLLQWNGTYFLSIEPSSVAGNAYFKSTDGVTWTIGTCSIGLGGGFFQWASGVRWLNGKWYIGFRITAPSPYYGIASSSDGVTWASSSAALSGQFCQDFAYANGQYVAVSVYGLNSASTVAYTSADGSNWTPRTIASGTWYGVAVDAASNAIPAGQYVVTSTPTSTTFTFDSVAPDRVSASATQTATPVAVGFLDNVPGSFLGASLYTNPGQETILQSNDRPPACRDIAYYRNHVFYAAPTPLTSATFALLSVGGAKGLQAGDTVTLNGNTVTAANVEDVPGLKFQIFTSSDRTPSQNIADTASSLMRVVNRNAATFDCYLIDLSDRQGVPGQMAVRSLVAGDASSFAYTSTVSGTPWSPSQGVTVPSETFLNELRWSKPLQPDAVPELNGVRIGASDKAIVRVMATRSSVFVLKEDGVYQLTGYSGPFQVDPFDMTTEIQGAETAVQLDNQVYFLSQNGIQRISDTGTTLISRPIEPPLLSGLANFRQAIKDVAFGLADNADHKYLLWLPSSGTDTYATQAYVYDYFTDVFTYRNDSAYFGITTDADRIILGTPSGTELERKTFTNADYVTALGAAISTSVQWSPKFGQDPAALNHFQEIGLLFRLVYFDSATVSFSTSVTTPLSWTSITLSGSVYGLSASGTEQFALRALVPPECRRAGLLNVRFQHAVAGAPMKLQALAVSFNPGPTRFGR